MVHPHHHAAAAAASTVMASHAASTPTVSAAMLAQNAADAANAADAMNRASSVADSISLPDGEFTERWMHLAREAPMSTFLAVVLLPLGVYLAVMGRRHHKYFSVAGIIFGLGMYLGLMGIDIVRSAIPMIPDKDYVNYPFAATVAFILVKLSFGLFKIFGAALGYGVGWGINSLIALVLTHAAPGVAIPKIASSCILVICAIGGAIRLNMALYSPGKSYVGDKIGILYSVIGGVLTCTSASLWFWLAGYTDNPDLWMMNIPGYGGGDNEFDFSETTNYYALACSIFFVYLGILMGRPEKGPEESTPLLGDPEKGDAKAEASAEEKK